MQEMTVIKQDNEYAMRYFWTLFTRYRIITLLFQAFLNCTLRKKVEPWYVSQLHPWHYFGAIFNSLVADYQ